MTDTVKVAVLHDSHITVEIKDIVTNGEHPPEPPDDDVCPANQCGIFATLFGGEADDEHSAYDNSYLNDTDLYVALPANIPDKSMRDSGVQVYNRATGKSAIGKVRDKGPWCTADNAYINSGARPLAETSYNSRTPLPSGSGPNAGKVAGNPAGIDLSPAMFDALGMDDNGPIDWRWADAAVA
jgi:hypothetical protein